ncbi:MAG: GntR family transcriptional regulator, partial [Verrucomicrobiaceae bacterium]
QIDGSTLDAQKVAHAFIKQKILNLEYPGGTWLKPNDIAQQIGLSRTPVREALRSLETEGLVTTRPNRGAVVTELAVGEVSDLFEIRAQLEAMAARSAAAKLQHVQMAQIEQMQGEMDGLRGDPARWMEVHNRFHGYIVSLSGRDRLAAELERYTTLVQPYIRLYIDVYGTPELPAYEHAQLFEALLSKDESRIGDAFMEHVLTTRSHVLKFLQNHYQYRDQLR